MDELIVVKEQLLSFFFTVKLFKYFKKILIYNLEVFMIFYSLNVCNNMIVLIIKILKAWLQGLLHNLIKVIL
jgi:hypothetical protein